jgi:hypothetical protein
VEAAAAAEPAPLAAPLDAALEVAFEAAAAAAAPAPAAPAAAPAPFPPWRPAPAALPPCFFLLFRASSVERSRWRTAPTLAPVRPSMIVTTLFPPEFPFWPLSFPFPAPYIDVSGGVIH